MGAALGRRLLLLSVLVVVVMVGLLSGGRFVFGGAIAHDGDDEEKSTPLGRRSVGTSDSMDVDGERPSSMGVGGERVSSIGVMVWLLLLLLLVVVRRRGGERWEGRAAWCGYAMGGRMPSAERARRAGAEGCGGGRKAGRVGRGGRSFRERQLMEEGVGWGASSR